MVDDLIKQLLEAGVHFGHQKKRWNPKMKKFIFGQRSGIYIIDLEKTAEYLNYACDFARELSSKGGNILFIGTKKQAQSSIEDEAKKSGMFYVQNRWLGGLLTNFQTVKQSIKKLKGIEKMEEDGTLMNLTKKEVSRLKKSKEKLMRDLNGIRDMNDHPQAVFIVDPKKEQIAVQEAKKLGIPIIAIVDTNCDPEDITYPIPGNDDALKSVRFITSLLAQSAADGKKAFMLSDAKAVNKPKEDAAEVVEADVAAVNEVDSKTAAVTPKE